jgi:3-deoxy-D-manno-octulosonic acid kinase
MPRKQSEPDSSFAEFVPMEDGRARLLVRRGYENAAPFVFDVGPAESVETVQGGREPHPVVNLPGGGRAVVRRYRRGGLLRRLNRELYFGGNRAFDELRATERARAGGARVPLVIAARESPALVGYRAMLATVLIPGARDAAEWLAAAADDARLAMLRDAGRQIGAMHAAGVAHPDINLRNLLVVEGSDGPEAWLIDFDKADVAAQPVADARRERDIRRLARSVRKLAAPVGVDGWVAMKEGYGPGWPSKLRLGRQPPPPPDAEPSPEPASGDSDGEET